MGLDVLQVNHFPGEPVISHRLDPDINPPTLDPEDWTELFGPPRRRFFHTNSDIEAEVNASVWCFHTDTHLGVASIVHSQTPASDQTPYADAGSGVDVLIDPGATAQHVVKLAVRPDGKRSFEIMGPGTPFHPYRFKTTGFEENGRWGCLCWVSFEDIGLTPKLSDVWGLNVVLRVNPVIVHGRISGCSLAPNFDFLKFPEQFLRLRFDGAFRVRDLTVDHQTPGVAKVCFALEQPERFEQIHLELQPSWGDVSRVAIQPSTDCEATIPHGIADRVMCELRILGEANGQKQELGRYRVDTPTVAQLRLDRPAHRYGPSADSAIALLKLSDAGLNVDALSLYRVTDHEQTHLFEIDVADPSRIVVPLADLPVGAYVIRFSDVHQHVTGECFLNRTAVDPPAVSRSDHYELSSLTDFPDDSGWNYFGRQHFDEYFEFFKSLGVQRIFWIDYGSFQDCPYYAGWSPHQADYTRKTFELVGDYLNAALMAARSHGLSFFATIKPFEAGIKVPGVVGMTRLPPAMQQKLHIVGHGVNGPIVTSCDEVTAYPDMFMKRRDWKPAYTGRIAKICLYHIDDQPVSIKPADLQIWVSDDNVSYRPYSGPRSDGQQLVYRNGWSCRCFELSGLELLARYVVLTCDCSSVSFVNRLSDMMEVFDVDGNAIEVSIGIYTGQGGKDGSPPTGPIRFGELGFGVLPGQTPEQTVMALDDGRRHVAIGFARGKDPLKLVPDTSEPAGLAFLLARIRRAIRAGVDGIHLRLQYHLQYFEPQMYGYSNAVVDAYRRQHGVDITQTLPDRDKFEAIHGDFYTAFYERVREMTDRAGINLYLQVPEVQGYMMELPVQLQWDKWIRLGLADAMMLKNIYPQTMRGDAIRVLSRRHGIALHMNTYDTRGRNTGQQKAVYSRLIQRSIEAGHDGYMLYEGLERLIRMPAGFAEQPHAFPVVTAFQRRVETGQYADDPLFSRLIANPLEASDWLIRIDREEIDTIRGFTDKPLSLGF